MKRLVKLVAIALLLSMAISFSNKLQVVSATSVEIILEEEDFKLEREEGKEYYNLVLKNKNISSERLNEIYRKIDTLQQKRNVGTILVIVDLLYTLFNTEVRPQVELDRTNKQKIDAVKNGWVSVEKNGYKYWYCKSYGNFRKGWYYDNYYKGWYYFIEMNDGRHFMFDARYFRSPWLRINNKWYEFNEGGKLKEKEGWFEYSKGKFLYHIEKDFGSPAMAVVKIGKYWYYFDADGLTNKKPVNPSDYKKLSY